MDQQRTSVIRWCKSMTSKHTFRARTLHMSLIDVQPEVGGFIASWTNVYFLVGKRKTKKANEVRVVIVSVAAGISNCTPELA